MVYLLFEIAATVLDGIFMTWFCAGIMGQDRIKMHPRLLIPLIYTALQLFMDHVVMPFSILPVIVITLACILYSLTFDKKRIFAALLSAGLFIMTITVGMLITFIPFNLFIEDFETTLYGAHTVARIIYLLLAKTTQFAALRFLLIVVKKNTDLSIGYGLLLILFHILSMVGLAAVMTLMLDRRFADFEPLLVFIAFAFLALDVFLYVLIYQISRLQRAKYELKLIKEKEAFEKERVSEATAIWENIRKTRHDLKNHLTVVAGYMEMGDSALCREYLDKLTQTVESMGDLIRSGNGVLDYLINSKFSARKDVRLVVSGSVTTLEQMEPVDLACIVGNILDNALEAQGHVNESERLIDLRFLPQQGYTVILCKNTVSGPVLQNGKLKKTAKSDPESHGLGHRIVESTAKKYGGWVDYFEEDGMFGVQVTLSRTQPPEKA